jgi:hypothetical protein
MVTEAVWLGATHVQAADARVVGRAVHEWAMVLWCAVAGADGGGGLRWLESIVKAVCMHVWAPC